MSIRVAFPHGGRWRMLRWYTEWEANHVILARTHGGIMAAMRTLVEREPDAEVRGYWEIDVWAPSPRMEALAHELDEFHERADFWSHIKCHADGLVSSKKKLPDDLRACVDYVPAPGDVPDDYSRRYHWGCRACSGTRLLIKDREAFYLARREAFRKLVPKRADRQTPSRAAQADDSLDLKVAGYEPGHHATGVSLHDFEMPEIDPDDADPCVNDSLRRAVFDDLLFYYTEACSLSPAEPERPLKEARNAQKRQSRMKEEARKKTQAQEKTASNERLLALLKGST